MSRFSLFRSLLLAGVQLSLSTVGAAAGLPPQEEKLLTRLKFPAAGPPTLVNFPGGKFQPGAGDYASVEDFVRSLGPLPEGTIAVTIYHKDTGELGKRFTILRSTGEVSYGRWVEGEAIRSLETYQPPNPEVAKQPPTMTTLAELWDFLRDLKPASWQVDFGADGKPTRSTLVGVSGQPNLEAAFEILSRVQLPKDSKTSSVVFYKRGPSSFWGVTYGNDGAVYNCQWSMEGTLLSFESPEGILRDPLLINVTRRGVREVRQANMAQDFNVNLREKREADRAEFAAHRLEVHQFGIMLLELCGFFVVSMVILGAIVWVVRKHPTRALENAKLD